MWSPPPGEVGGVKSASCRQSLQTARFHTTLPNFDRRPQRIIIGARIAENSGIGRTQACFRDGFVIYSVKIA